MNEAIGMAQRGKGDLSPEDVVVPKDLECLICGDLFENAVSVEACGHTFCSVCFRIHYREAKEKRCPLCKICVANDIRRVLVVNRPIQTRVNEFKRNYPLAAPTLASRNVGSNAQESPIRERMQSRNYSMLLKSGKKDLQKVCKEYKLPMSGSEQELVDRLRYFQCMWDAELDSIDTPLTPSELVTKFKKKERLQREEKSRAMITGTSNDTKHIRKLTALLLHENAKNSQKVRNDKRVGSASSGNVMFDIKFRDNFAALIAQGRKHMKKRPGCPRRTYDDDHIHDKPAPTTNSMDNDEGDDGSIIENSCVDSNADKCSAKTPYPTARDAKYSSKQLGDDGSAAAGSSTTNRSSRKNRKRPLNPCTEQREKICSNESSGVAGNRKISEHVSRETTVISTTSKQLGPSTHIFNPYKKNRRKTPSKVVSTTCMSSREKNYLTSPNNSQNSGNKTPNGTPCSHGTAIPSATKRHSDKVRHNEKLCSRPTAIISQDDTSAIARMRPTPNKLMIRNPYLKSYRKPNL